MRPRGAALVTISAIIGLAVWLALDAAPPATTDCRFTALDVGQGDALLIQTPDHQDILIDGGPGSAVVERLSQRLPAGDNDIEFMISTHPDSDHLAGLVAVMKKFQVKTVLTTGVVVKTKVYGQWEDLLREQQPTILYAQAEQSYTVGPDARIDILWPVGSLRDVPWTAPGKNGVGGTNDTGIVAKATCAGSTVLLTADTSHDVEEKMISRGLDLHAALLKIGHHGSRFSSALEFLKAVQPVQVVVSVGAKNTYGHPHPIILQRLVRLGIPLFRTDQEGDVPFVSDGHGGWNHVDEKN